LSQIYQKPHNPHPEQEDSMTRLTTEQLEEVHMDYFIAEEVANLNLPDGVSPHHVDDDSKRCRDEFIEHQQRVKKHFLRLHFGGVSPEAEGETSGHLLDECSLALTSYDKRVGFNFNIHDGQEPFLRDSTIYLEHLPNTSIRLKEPKPGATSICNSGPPYLKPPKNAFLHRDPFLQHELRLAKLMAPLYTELFWNPDGSMAITTCTAGKDYAKQIDTFVRNASPQNVFCAWHGGAAEVLPDGSVYGFGMGSGPVVSWLRKNVDRGVRYIHTDGLRLTSGHADGTVSFLFMSPQRFRGDRNMYSYNNFAGQSTGMYKDTCKDEYIAPCPLMVLDMSIPPTVVGPGLPQPVRACGLYENITAVLYEDGTLNLSTAPAYRLPHVPSVPRHTRVITGVERFSEDTPGYLHIYGADRTTIVRICADSPHRAPVLHLLPGETLYPHALRTRSRDLDDFHLILGGPAPRVAWLPTGGDEFIPFGMRNARNALLARPPIHIRRGDPAAAAVDLVDEDGWSRFVTGEILTAGISIPKVLKAHSHHGRTQPSPDDIKTFLTNPAHLGALVPRRARAGRASAHLSLLSELVP
jgi:hypothetical protein